MDVVTLGAALSIMKKMPDTAASSAAAAEDAAGRAEEAARTFTIDDTLTKEGQPADSKAVGDALAEKLDIADLPDTNTVSNANQLLSDKYVVDTEPYHLRPSGGQSADREFDTIVGGSAVWNQLVDDSDSFVTVTSGHKYIAKIDNAYSVAASDGTAVAVTGGTDGVFDITQMFGSTIADYIYSLEQATAGAGVAWFRKYFPKDYYEYNAGELMHVTDLQSHDTVGLNLWDEEWEVGNYELTAGNKTNDTACFRNKNSIKILPNTQYKILTDSRYVAKVRTLYYDADMEFISSPISDTIIHTSPANAAYMNFYIRTSPVKYSGGICISISSDRDGDYEPYKKHSYHLDSSLTLRGIPKLTADGDLTYDGDIYKPDGTVERRYGIVDLGTLTWTVQTAETGVFKSSGISSLTPNVANLKIANIICDKFITSVAASPMPNNAIAISSAGAIFVKDSVYANISAADFKTAMSDVYLVYELAEPTTEDAEPYQHLQILDPYGTEEYVTTSLVPVGHETKYPENLRAKIEGLPWNFASLIAPVEAEFKATRNYTSGSLFIVNNTLYKATANIANGGTITPNTNCTATTLAEIIAAL